METRRGAGRPHRVFCVEMALGEIQWSPQDRACRVLLLDLERKGAIKLSARLRMGSRSTQGGVSLSSDKKVKGIHSEGCSCGNAAFHDLDEYYTHQVIELPEIKMNGTLFPVAIQYP
jgi:hypothetical protein